MSRLIDADKLMKNIIGICKCQPSLEGRQKETVYIKDVIENQPTAYDVDKVVGELEVLREKAQKRREELIGINSYHNVILRDNEYERGRVYAFDDAIEVVKDGGIDE